MKVSELLDSADKWCKHAYAYDKSGVVVSPLSDLAVEWCLLGAIHRCYAIPSEIRNVCHKVTKIIQREYNKLAPFSYNIQTFNDIPDTKYSDIRKFVLEADI